jgi:hypothetical protein
LVTAPADERERDQHDGDVVHAARVQGELQQRVGGAGRIVERVRERDLGQGRRLGLVVPQPVGADQHDPAAGRFEPGHVRLRRGHVGTEPAGDHVRLRRGHGLGLGHLPLGHQLLGERVVLVSRADSDSVASQ